MTKQSSRADQPISFAAYGNASMPLPVITVSMLHIDSNIEHFVEVFREEEDVDVEVEVDVDVDVVVGRSLLPKLGSTSIGSAVLMLP